MTPDPRLDAYIANSAVFAQPILRHLRALVHRACPAAEETIRWGMPSFTHHGILCQFAAFKTHCRFSFWNQSMKTVTVPGEAKPGREMTSFTRFGRLTCLADLPDDRTLLRLLKAAVKLNEAGTPVRPRPVAKPKPALRVPADLAAALRGKPAAAKAFAGLSPGYRREYIEWITESKRPETRQKRIATTLAQLAEGKSLHWKYQGR